MEMGVLMFASPKDTVTTAKTMEQLDFDSMVLADTQCLTPEVWSQLMLVAVNTDKIEIGTGVTNPVSRDPAVTASAALGIQIQSGGRLVIGIGRGDSSMGKIGSKPASPVLFETYIRQLRDYLDGKEVDRHGNPSRIEWLDQCEVPYVPIEVAATGPKVIELAARAADRICFAVGADEERLADCIARARDAAAAAGRDPDQLKLGAYINCVIHPDESVARSAIRGGLSVFAHFSGFKGMDISALPDYVKNAAGHLRDGYDMRDHARADGANAQALDHQFIHRFGIAGSAEMAEQRLRNLKALGLDFLRVVPGSKDAPREVLTGSMLALSQLKTKLKDERSDDVSLSSGV